MNFQLSIRIPFEAMDSIAARQHAVKLLNSLDLPKEKVLKLQQLMGQAEPIGIKLNLEKEQPDETGIPEGTKTESPAIETSPAEGTC